MGGIDKAAADVFIFGCQQWHYPTKTKIGDMQEIYMRASYLRSYGNCNRNAVGQAYGIERGADGMAKAGITRYKETVAALFGTICHEIVARTIKGETQIPVDEVWQKHIDENEIIVWDETTPNKNRAITQTGAIVNQFEQYWHSLGDTAWRVEEGLRASVSQLTGEVAHEHAVITGTPDIITMGGRVIDWKTGLRMKQYPPQLAAYGFIANIASEGEVSVKRLEHIWISRKTLKMERFEYDYQESLPAMRNIVMAFLNSGKWARDKADDEGIRAHLGGCLPNVDSPACGRKYCALYDTPYCREGVAAHGGK